MTFAKFLQLFRVAVSDVTNYSSLLSPNEQRIVEVTRNKINDQLALMMTSCFPGELATVAVP